MATVTRQPFAPLDGARLQTLTSLKNRQNALPSSAPVKRKAADSSDGDDFENVDPALFSKRSKGSESLFSSKDSFIKPAKFILTKSNSTSELSFASAPKAATPRPRTHLNPKSPAAKLNSIVTKSTTPLSAPAGRSPTRGKRAGILSSRRRTGGAFSRVDPPSFNLSSASSTPFSLDAALKGTIPSYSSRNGSSTKSSSSNSLDLGGLHDGELTKSSWSFEIHEDTEDQHMTNLLQHSTCVLDISSDEESESRRQRECAEGKENVPPIDDISQTSSRHHTRAQRQPVEDEMVFEKERNPLGELDAREYYSEGCDENTVIIIPGDEDDDDQPQQPTGNGNGLDFAPEMGSVESDIPDPEVVDGKKSVDELMVKTDEPAPSAALLEPMEGTGESFEVWESGSAQDEAETAVVEASGC
ncbi:hypothetical protein F4821DRAFT_34503 [Hypoxylon rubiginosum]|uniref:Uncharacterized protein n=1 Tax=Hypoxylon rubiginosum TaxID=110542 RepID=A0ACC0CLA0_9PEZI|nr:hypothetical protein F4821DRAFT_34503 [Hypoxylon rubiginosum]